jgi:hypothetical protein
MADIVEEEGAQVHSNVHVVVGSYRVARAALLIHVEDQGSFSMQCFGRLSDDEKKDVLEQIAVYAIKLIKGISAVKAERDSSNLLHVSQTRLQCCPDS